MTDIVCARLSVFGRVQGVWYRASTREQARALGLVGTVGNRTDGSVTVLVQGPEPAVQGLIDWCRSGPPMSRVARVEIEWIEPDPLHLTFTIAR